jgi:predicted SprT family Zn-dependent metalloprotease
MCVVELDQKNIAPAWAVKLVADECKLKQCKLIWKPNFNRRSYAWIEEQQIRINGVGNKESEYGVWVVLHEIAHHNAYKMHGKKIKMHGKEFIREALRLYIKHGVFDAVRLGQIYEYPTVKKAAIKMWERKIKNNA